MSLSGVVKNIGSPGVNSKAVFAPEQVQGDKGENSSKFCPASREGSGGGSCSGGGGSGTGGGGVRYRTAIDPSDAQQQQQQ